MQLDGPAALASGIVARAIDMRTAHMRILISSVVVLSALAGCGWGGDDTPTAIQAPSPDRPPVTCMARATDQCPLDRPDTPREAVTALGKCAEAWQGCHEETLKWRARQDEIDAVGETRGE